MIRGDPWRLYIPRVFGSVAFVCDRRLAPYRGRPAFSSGGNTPVFNILNAIQDLPDGLAASLTKEELESLVLFFVSAGQATTALEETLSAPLVPEARDDLRAAVEQLLSKPSSNCGFSKWSSLQFVEKLLKAYLTMRSTPFRRIHELSELANLAEDTGLLVNRTALQAVQCAAAVRYDSQTVSLSEALAAHHSSLTLCHQIACGILGKKAFDGK